MALGFPAGAAVHAWRSTHVCRLLLRASLPMWRLSPCGVPADFASADFASLPIWRLCPCGISAHVFVSAHVACACAATACSCLCCPPRSLGDQAVMRTPCCAVLCIGALHLLLLSAAMAWIPPGSSPHARCPPAAAHCQHAMQCRRWQLCCCHHWACCRGGRRRGGGGGLRAVGCLFSCMVPLTTTHGGGACVASLGARGRGQGSASVQTTAPGLEGYR
mmetsp:Transcript_45035/g.134404  ORF Transcript_45035/g.134404 Transcript_45035/m.134404 type:complete len:219 (-) Transcript_45035:540-1196(-)